MFLSANSNISDISVPISFLLSLLFCFELDLGERCKNSRVFTYTLHPVSSNLNTLQNQYNYQNQDIYSNTVLLTNLLPYLSFTYFYTIVFLFQYPVHPSTLHLVGISPLLFSNVYLSLSLSFSDLDILGVLVNYFVKYPSSFEIP